MMRVIKPQQDYITDALEEILAQDKIFVELYFKDLQDDKVEEVEDTSAESEESEEAEDTSAETEETEE